MARFGAEDVRRYYDRNTSAFMALGQGGGAIHRAVWAPGIASRADAFHYIDAQIAERLSVLAAAAHVIDLGCGVGASLCYLAQRFPGIRGTGITLSPVQAQYGRERVDHLALSSRVAILEGDYCDVPAAVPPADLAYAIESFVHGPDPVGFFAQCRRLVRPGGFLILCDDFRRPTNDAAAASAIERFTRGWQINTLLEARELQRMAQQAGFVH